VRPVRFLNLYTVLNYKEAHQGFGDFKIGGQVIRRVKYANDLALLARKRTGLQGMIDTPADVGKC